MAPGRRRAPARLALAVRCSPIVVARMWRLDIAVEQVCHLPAYQGKNAAFITPPPRMIRWGKGCRSGWPSMDSGLMERTAAGTRWSRRVTSAPVLSGNLNSRAGCHALPGGRHGTDDAEERSASQSWEAHVPPSQVDQPVHQVAAQHTAAADAGADGQVEERVRSHGARAVLAQPAPFTSVSETDRDAKCQLILPARSVLRRQDFRRRVNSDMGRRAGLVDRSKGCDPIAAKLPAL